LIHVEGAPRAEDGDDDGQAHGSLGGGDDHHKENEYLPLDPVPVVSEGDEGQVDRVQHQLNGHEHGDDVAAQEDDARRERRFGHGKGIFAGGGDLSQAGDSEALFDLNGLSEHMDPPKPGQADRKYIGSADPKDPVLSPLYSDLKGFPPTLFVTSTRDLALSSTVILHRAFLRAGVEAQLVVFEALPHAFWNNPELPESKEADHLMAAFFDHHLGM